MKTLYVKAHEGDLYRRADALVASAAPDERRFRLGNLGPLAYDIELLEF